MWPVAQGGQSEMDLDVYQIVELLKPQNVDENNSPFKINEDVSNSQLINLVNCGHLL